MRKWGSISRRREGLEISHLSAVKSLPPERQEEWLDKASPEQVGMAPRMSTRELSEAIREEEHGPSEVMETVRCETCQGSGRIPVDKGANS